MKRLVRCTESRWPDDAARMVQIAHDAGYDVSPADAEHAWSVFSEQYCASWLCLPDDSAVILRVLKDVLIEESP